MSIRFRTVLAFDRQATEGQTDRIGKNIIVLCMHRHAHAQ